MTLKIAPEVAETFAKKGAVVALESTLVTHGFPYPENLNIARESEAEIRKAGAVPATIAIVDGVLRVGLSGAELQDLAQPDRNLFKATTRDLPLCVAAGKTAGTTVAATMNIAARAGINLFATGGIGGVHRGVAETWDVSADLTELSRTPVCVICAGAKSLLDLPKTLEMLETLGVPVIGFDTDEFPAFYTRASGLKLDSRVDTVDGAARVVRVHKDLGLQNGILIVNPLDAKIALPADEMERHVAEGLRLAEAQGIKGKAATPFLLKHLSAATDGRTIEPNKALIRANARLAAQIAVACTQG